MATTRSHDPLVWIDCEMTGLEPETDTIMSICCFITDSQLTLLEPKGFDTTIHHSLSSLSAMGEWCTRVHTASGLTAACLSSSTTAQQASDGLLTYIKTHIPEPRVGLLAGNSIHQDKAFLRKGPFNAVLEHLHYRILDVSSLKEAVRRWGSEELLRGAPRKKGSHHARDDVLESIDEARYYRNVLFGVKEADP